MTSYTLIYYIRLKTSDPYPSGCVYYTPIVTTSPFSYVVETSDNRTLLVNYPCTHGFDYMVTGAAVWAVFLPFHIFTLLGNCWRQCCCCLCDPLVCCSCICDIIKR